MDEVVELALLKNKVKNGIDMGQFLKRDERELERREAL